ncbi:hypothetical protein PV350_13610 [Streptomyces sp. PA03-6a]|nr:hypothetical protein [Streptomyces sp. PA03-6a]
MAEGIGAGALFRFDVPHMTGSALAGLIDAQVSDLVQRAGLRSLVDSVESGRVELMPAYGLHNLPEANRAGVMPALAESLRQAEVGRPAVILGLGDFGVDFAPEYQADWLMYGDLSDPGFHAALDALQPGEVAVVKGGHIPQGVFQQLYQLGSLPALLEGANTANLVQLLGRPFFSVLTKHTPYDIHDLEVASRLQAVTDAITRPSAWGEELEFADAWPLMSDIRTARSVLGRLPVANGLSGGRVLGQEEVPRLTKVGVSAAEIVGVLGDRPEVRAVLQDPSKANPRHVRYDENGDVISPSVEITAEQFGELRGLVEGRRETAKAELQAELGGYSVAPRVSQVAVVASAIRDVLRPGSDVDEYFRELKRRAQDPQNDQVLQALKYVLDHLPLVADAAVGTTQTATDTSDTARDSAWREEHEPLTVSVVDFVAAVPDPPSIVAPWAVDERLVNPWTETAAAHHGPEVLEPPAARSKGKGRATPATPHGIDLTVPGGDWRASGDASVALTDARRGWDDALDAFEDVEQQHLQGVGSSGHADGSALARAWEGFVRTDMERALAEQQWSETTGGSPLPEVREVEARYGVLPGGSPVSRWLRGLRGQRDVAGGPPSVVRSVMPVPSASHVIIDRTRAAEATGRDVHVLIPTSRDLTVAHWLQHPADVDRAFQADMDALTKARAGATHDELITALDTRIASLIDDLELFRSLEDRPVWSELRTPQVAALVMVERRALRTLDADRAALTSKLRSGDWPWAKPYLVGGGIDWLLDSLVTKVLHYLRNDMSLTINVDLGKAVEGTDGSVLDAMVQDNTVLVRNAWEGTSDHLSYLLKSRPVEESLGYAATVKRTGGPDRAGVYPARTNTPGDLFAPTDFDRSLLPVSTVLTSSHRPQALQQHGSAVFHLKPQVMERATFTPTDSFDSGPGGAEGVTGLGNMVPLLNHGPESLVRLAFAEATDFALDTTYRGLRDSGDLPSQLQQFIEAQVHGRIAWEDLDLVVLFHDGADATKAGEALTQKTVLETFARDNDLSFTVDTVPVFPKPRRGGDPVLEAGTGVPESFEDLRFIASLLDEHGAPRADLLEETATVDDIRPASAPKLASAPDMLAQPLGDAKSAGAPSKGAAGHGSTEDPHQPGRGDRKASEPSGRTGSFGARASRRSQRRVKVPGDGRCLLYSVVASLPPEHWPSYLRDARYPDASDQHQAVVRQIRAHRAGEGVGPGTVLGRTAERLHTRVLEWVRERSAEDIPLDVVEAYRRGQQDAMTRALEANDEDELRTKLISLSVQHVDKPEWLEADELSKLYLEERVRELKEARELLADEEARSQVAGTELSGEGRKSPSAQLDYLVARTGGVSVDHIRTPERLAVAVSDSMLRQPLTADERMALINALKNWAPGNAAWASGEGEMFPALVAHTLEIRLRSFSETGGDRLTHWAELGPRDTGRTANIRYDGSSHYDAVLPTDTSDAETIRTSKDGREGAAPVHGALGTALSTLAEEGEASTPVRVPAPIVPGAAIHDFVPIGQGLDERRPARLDRDLPPAPVTTGPVRFGDGARLPVYLTGEVDFLLRQVLDDEAMQNLPKTEAQGSSGALGHGGHRLRGIDKVLEELSAHLEISSRTRPEQSQALLAKVERQLKSNPQGFFGDVKPFVYKAADGRARTLDLTIRPYGNWERFTFGLGNPVNTDTMQRFTLTGGESKLNATSMRVAATASLGPALVDVAGAGSVSAGVTFGKQVRYNMHNHVMNQTETRTSDASHAHLDDVWYEFSVTEDSHHAGPSGKRQSVHDDPTLARFGFAVRSGLIARLSDSLTFRKPRDEEPLPKELDLRHSRPRIVNTEAFGPLRHIRKWVEEQAAVKADSKAAAQIDTFFSSAGFQQMSRHLHMGELPTPCLFDGRVPLGSFSVRVTSGKAVLISETDAAELRESLESTVRNERLATKFRSIDASGSAGPGGHLFGMADGAFDLRMLLGGTIRLIAARIRSILFGGAGGIKIAAQVKDAPTGLYLVHKAVTVTSPPRAKANPPKAARDGSGRPGKLRKNPPWMWSEKPQTQVFHTWALERLTLTEARRFAAPAVDAPAVDAPAVDAPAVDAPAVDAPAVDAPAVDAPAVDAPAVAPKPPPYLLPDLPYTLGQSRMTEFQFLDGKTFRNIDGETVDFATHLADAVLREIDKAYPGVVDATKQPMHPDDPRWRGRTHFLTVQANTQEVRRQLSSQGMEATLHAMTTKALPIHLIETGRFSRGHRYVSVKAQLTDLRYEPDGPKDQRIRYSAPGSTNVNGHQSRSRTGEGGVMGLVSVRDTERDANNVPIQIGTASAGGSYGRRTESGSGFGATATHEAMSISTGGSEPYSYKVSLEIRRGGYWRFRRWLRGLLFLNLLGTRAFVFPEQESVLVVPSQPDSAQMDVPVLGRVLLSVPVEHTNPTGSLLPTDDKPRKEGMSAGDARDLALGTARALETWRPSALLEHPHQIVAVMGGEQTANVVQQVLGKASGDSWLVTQRGAAAYDAAERNFRYESLVANFDQTSSPDGLRMTGLLSTAPYLDRWTDLVHRTTVLPEIAALTPAEEVETEISVFGSLHAVGRTTRTRTLFIGGQTSYLKPHDVGDGVLGSYGMVASPYHHDAVTTEVVRRTATSEITRTDAGHQVLVTAPVLHEVAALSSRVGYRVAGSRVVPASLAGVAGAKLEFPQGLMAHIPEKSAHLLKVLDDGLGDVPRYNERWTWRPMPWLMEHRFGSWPVNVPDTSRAAVQFAEGLRSLGVSREEQDHLRALLSQRVVRALNKEMTRTGSSVPAHIGRWGSKRAGIWIGGRPVRLRVRLIPVGSGQAGDFRGLGHSVDLEDYLMAAETVQESTDQSSGRVIGLAVSELARTGDDVAAYAGPTYLQSGSTMQSVTQMHSEGEGYISAVTTTQAHGEYATKYRIRIDLESDDAVADPLQSVVTGQRTHYLSVDADAGTFIEQFPISLMRPAPRDSLEQDDPLAPQPFEKHGPPRRVPLPQSAGADGWYDVPLRHDSSDAAERRFEMPDEGFSMRAIVGLDGLHTANTLALGAAYDASLKLPENGDTDAGMLARAMRTPLTLSGTGAAQSLEDGTSNGALASFYYKTRTPDGYQVAGLTHTGALGGADGSLRLHSKPDLSQARLLHVADGVRFDGTTRSVEGSGFSFSRAGASHHTVHGGPTISTPATGFGQQNSGSGAPELDAVTFPSAGDRLASANVKRHDAARAFLFAVPTKWLSIAHVHHHVKDSKVVDWGRSVFGLLQRVPQAMETDTTALAWIREDVARRFDLINDTNFPAHVASSWDEVTKADAAWTAADKAYWDLRRDEGAMRVAELARAESTLKSLTGRDVNTAPTVKDAEEALAELEKHSSAGPDTEGTPRSVRIEDVRAKLKDLEEARTQAWASVVGDTARSEVREAQEFLSTLEAQRVAARENWDAPWSARIDEVRTDLEAARAHAQQDGADADSAPAVREAEEALAELQRQREVAHEQWDAARDEQTENAREVLETAQRQEQGWRDALISMVGALRRVSDTRETLWALRTKAEDLAAEFARVRLGADRITAWHQLHATEDGRVRLGDIPEPEPVRFVEPGSEEPSDPEATDSAPLSTGGADSTTDAPSADMHDDAATHPAYAIPPWRRQGEHSTDEWSFDADTSHRTLTLTRPDGETEILDLRWPATGGNGFYAAVLRAMGSHAGDERPSTPLDLAHRVADSPVQGDHALFLDPRAVFHIDELNSGVFKAVLQGDPELVREIETGGGRLPARIRLTSMQKEQLARLNLRTARRWDERTMGLASALTARNLRIDLTVVNEDGTHQTHLGTAASPSGIHPSVIVYRRGDSFMAAIRQGSTGPRVALPATDSATFAEKPLTPPSSSVRDSDSGLLSDVAPRGQETSPQEVMPDETPDTLSSGHPAEDGSDAGIGQDFLKSAMSIFRRSPRSGAEAYPSSAEIPGASAGVGAQVVSTVDELKQRIEEEFGISLNSVAGVEAVKHLNRDAPDDVLEQVQPQQWTLSQLKELHAALTHFAQILGSNRMNSSRRSKVQEVRIVGLVNWGVRNKRIARDLAGQYFSSVRLVNLYGGVLNDVGAFEEAAIHELAHGLVGYAQKEFIDKFWSGVEEVVFLDGAKAVNPHQDFEFSFALYLKNPDTMDRDYPLHAKVVRAWESQYPNLVKIEPGEDARQAGKRIARALKAYVGIFEHEVKTWTFDGKPKVFFPAGMERPITAYGEKDAWEDLAETMRGRFAGESVLRENAPLRAEFSDRLIDGWRRRRALQGEQAPQGHDHQMIIQVLPVETGGADMDVSPQGVLHERLSRLEPGNEDYQRVHEALDIWSRPESERDHDEGEPTTIGGIAFDEGSSEVTAQHRKEIDRWAFEVAYVASDRARGGFLPPRVVVVGHDSGTRDALQSHFGEALRLGQERADRAAEAFRSALERHLSQMQADGKTIVTASEIEVVSRSSGLDPHETASHEDPDVVKRHTYFVVYLPGSRDR